MRWRMITAAVLLIGTLAGGLCCRALVARHCRQVEDLIVQVQARPEAAQPLEQALGLWEEWLPFLSSLLNHEQLEQVGLSLARAKGCQQAGDAPGCLEQLEAALYLLDDIREYDDISWKNLL